jgi:RNA polymerase sigma-70 factor (ECF subfamily)
MAAWDGADADALAALMHEDIRITMPPYPFWFEGRHDAIRSLAANLTPTGNAYRGTWRFLPTTLNQQPTLAAYLKTADDTTYRPFAFDVFRIEGGLIAELTAFEITDINRFGLPPHLDENH